MCGEVDEVAERERRGFYLTADTCMCLSLEASPKLSHTHAHAPPPLVPPFLVLMFSRLLRTNRPPSDASWSEARGAVNLEICK
eukprot:m.222793 g.222793  ORF g.222793 m.222793 type:complete len:83 (+) comp54182_c0_seq11:119-367(+)